MFRNTTLSLHFVRCFAHTILAVWPIMFTLVLSILMCGVAISYVEGLAMGKAMYFAFITGLTIGYGDITPQTATGGVLSVLLGLIGTILVGLTAAIAVRALRETVKHESFEGR